MAYDPSEEPIRLPVPVIKKAGTVIKEPHRTQRRKARRSRDKRLAGKTLASYFLCVAFLAGLLLLILRGRRDESRASPSDYQYVLVESEQKGEHPDGTPVVSLGALAAEKWVSDALASPPEKLAGFFRLEPGMPPAGAAEILGQLREKEGDVAKLRWIGIRYIGDMVVEEVITEREKDRKISVRLAQIIHRRDGSHLIDFNSYLRKSSHSWEDILGGKVKKAVVRVNISESNYHNGFFRDDSKWHSFAFGSPDMDTLLYGYAETGTDQEKRLKDILAIERKGQRVTIEIRKDDKFMPRQFLISRVVAQDWVEEEPSGDAAAR